jgi:hypothetical protein
VRTTFGDFCHWTAQRLPRRPTGDPAHILIRALADCPFLPRRITSRGRLEQYLTTPGYPDGRPGDWSRKAWTEILPDPVLATDLAWVRDDD